MAILKQEFRNYDQAKIRSFVFLIAIFLAENYNEEPIPA